MNYKGETASSFSACETRYPKVGNNNKSFFFFCSNFFLLVVFSPFLPVLGLSGPWLFEFAHGNAKMALSFSSGLRVVLSLAVWIRSWQCENGTTTAKHKSPIGCLETCFETERNLAYMSQSSFHRQQDDPNKHVNRTPHPTYSNTLAFAPTVVRHTGELTVGLWSGTCAKGWVTRKCQFRMLSLQEVGHSFFFVRG